MTGRLRLRSLLSRVKATHPKIGEPLDEALATVDDLAEVDGENADAIEKAADVIDAVLAFDLVVPGALGALLERFDGFVIRALLRWVDKRLKIRERKRGRRRKRKPEG